MAPNIAKVASFVGAAKETTPGTAVAPTIFHPATTMQPKDIKNYAADEGIRGSYVDNYGQIPTQGWSTYSIGGNAYMSGMLPLILKSILGDETITGSAPYSHAMSVLNTGQPPTYTVTHFNGYNARAYAYSMFSSLTVNFAADGLLSYTADAMGFASATATTPTASFSTDPARAAYTGAISIGGSATTLVQSGSLTIARSVNPVPAINNSASPQSLFGGAVTVSGNLVLIYQDDSQVTPYLSGTQQALDLSWASGAGAATRTLTLHTTAGLYTDEDLDYGEDYLKLNITLSGVANTTDAGASGGYSGIKATVVNNTSTAY